MAAAARAPEVFGLVCSNLSGPRSLHPVARAIAGLSRACRGVALDAARERLLPKGLPWEAMDDPLRNPAAWPCPHADAYRRLLTLLGSGGGDIAAVAAAYKDTCECACENPHPEIRCNRCNRHLVSAQADWTCADGRRHLAVANHDDDFLRGSALWNMVLHGVFNKALMRVAVASRTDYSQHVAPDWTLYSEMPATVMGIPERTKRPVDPDAVRRFAAEHFKPFTWEMCANDLWAATRDIMDSESSRGIFEETCIGLADCPVARDAMLLAYSAEIDALDQCCCTECQFGGAGHPEDEDMIVPPNTQECREHFEAMRLRVLAPR